MIKARYTREKSIIIYIKLEHKHYDDVVVSECDIFALKLAIL